MDYFKVLKDTYESQYPDFKINKCNGLCISRIDEYDPKKHTAPNLHFEKLENPDAIYLVNVNTYNSTTPALGKTINEAIERCLAKLSGRGKIVKTITLRRDVRNRWFYVIPMPLNKDGYGPTVSADDFHKMTYEVWDQELTSHGSFDILPDAIQFAEDKNEAWDKENDSIPSKPEAL